MKYKCIIFDCDGVLVDSEAISAKVFRKMMSELGCELEQETVLEQITGTSMKENLKFFTEHLGKDLPEDFEEEFRKRSFQAFKTDLKPVPGVHEIIEKLRIPFGVASSGPVKKIKLNLTSTNLADKFGENIFSSYDIGSWKPEPDIYLHAAKKMGFSPQQCAVVEDSIPGVKAARAGGFDVYAFSTKLKEEEFKKLGAEVFYSMEELGSLLNIN
ncbi:HAD family hydrolase [Maribellus maritimus]|uniref:HAD family hydrolase n=1 Tax=Maribellus maritimus TaxID=2870838 RepID=UPI001EEC6A6F|nr:HAD family hydrolase [Maribellus maritimus]MCG6187272.1 HAD-IA family hydrolase [Maribellus maritimus]